MGKRLVIAVDGPAGVGKSTVARNVARQLGFVYVNSGATYRALALHVLEQGISPGDVSAVVTAIEHAEVRLKVSDLQSAVYLGQRALGPELWKPEVSLAASKVARLPEVRRKLVELQREAADEAKHGIVMEGRDIGTVVFPDAALKIFLEADPLERARRRLNQEREQGSERTLRETAHEMAGRDQSDTERQASPLTAAHDAVHIDTTRLTADEVVGRILQLAAERDLTEQRRSR
jgi:cytidylate kinase